MKEFDTREKNIALSRESEHDHLGLISASFSLIDELLDVCNARITDDYFNTCGIAIARGKNYGLGCYSLMLDGHAQEAGAMVRPLWEYTEVLAYFSEDKHRTKQVASNSLPSAGALSRRVSGDLQGFRNYLNKHASHRSFDKQATTHMFDENGYLKKSQKPAEDVLSRNLRDLFVMLWLFCNEGLNAIAIGDKTSALPIGERLETLRDKGISEFNMTLDPEA